MTIDNTLMQKLLTQGADEKRRINDALEATISPLPKAFFRIFLARHALDNEGIRKNVLLKNIDWDAAQRTDEFAGPSLRVLFALPEK